MAIKLDNIVLEGKKIFANIPRYGTKEGKEVGGKVIPGFQTEGRNSYRTYAEAFHNRNPRNNSVGRGGIVKDGNTSKCIYFSVAPENVNCFRKAYTGIVKSLGA